MDRQTLSNELPLLLDAKRIMAVIGLPRSVVYRMLKRSDMPVVRIGGRLFLHRDRFLAWIDSEADGVER